MSDDTTIIAYKGFDKNLRCRGFQYAEGQSYEMDGEPVVCERGFHACANPFDVLDHYGLFNGCGTPNRFAEVELGGKTVADTDVAGNVRKVAGTKIRVKAELSIAGFIKTAVDWVLEKTRPDKVDVETPTNDAGKKFAKIGSSGYGAQIGSSGDCAQIGSSGYGAQIGSSGYGAKIGSSGDCAQIGSSGDGAKIGSSGNCAKIGSSGYGAKIGSSGYGAKIGSSGDGAKIGSSGDGAQISSTGEDSVVMMAGGCSSAAAALGSWITLAEWKYNEMKGRYVPVAVKTERVDGKKIKAGVSYQLVDGKFSEVG